jgi:ABC-type transporter Mla subunit MlaD
MPEWVGPVVAISLAIIALCFLGLVALTLKTLQETLQRGQALGQELNELRQELTPALRSLNRLGTQGAEMAELAREEVQEMLGTVRHVRHDVERGWKRTRERLADFEAVVDVVQEEVEEAALDLTATLHTVRMGTGMIGRLRRLVLPRRRGRS